MYCDRSLGPTIQNWQLGLGYLIVTEEKWVKTEEGPLISDRCWIVKEIFDIIKYGFF